MRYAGPADDGLRLRGFAIAAGALGCSVCRLGAAAIGGPADVFIAAK